MPNHIFLVYKFTSPSGKSYIGQTRDFKRRINAHKRHNSGCRSLSGAIKKYGWGSFTHEILAEGLTLEDANRLEAEMIESHGTMHPRGYNLLMGGDNRIPSEDTLIRMRASKQNIPVDVRRKISETKTRMCLKHSTESKLRISEFHTGREKTNEERRKLSEAHTGKKFSIETRAKMSKAKSNVSQETREKMSIAKKGRKQTPEIIEKRRKAVLGRAISVEARRKISAALTGHSVSEEARFKMSVLAKGRVISKETRMKMLASRLANLAAKKLSAVA